MYFARWFQNNIQNSDRSINTNNNKKTKNYKLNVQYKTTSNPKGSSIRLHSAKTNCNITSVNQAYQKVSSEIDTKKVKTYG